MKKDLENYCLQKGSESLHKSIVFPTAHDFNNQHAITINIGLLGKLHKLINQKAFRAFDTAAQKLRESLLLLGLTFANHRNNWLPSPGLHKYRKYKAYKKPSQANRVWLKLTCIIVLAGRIREEPHGRISQVAAGVHSSTFPARQTPSDLSIRLCQTRPTPFPANIIPTLGQSKHSPAPHHRITPVRHRPCRQIINQRPNIFPKFQIDPTRRHPQRGIAVNAVKDGVHALAVKFVPIVAEETPVQEDPAGGGGDAAGDARASGGEALEAVVAGQVAVALEVGVDGDAGGVDGVLAPLVGRHPQPEALHGAREQWDVAGVRRHLGLAADENRFGDSRVGQPEGHKSGREEDEEGDPCWVWGVY
ncbi:gag-Pro polyprotein [Striga asiatica]|uniref:Gag-Pro polyprotein n=1 Tax=Striga asiatica TaxID=4170 RepID=A0A5A7QSH8_STRAF|nr:gag-Pro polyprotein [Striga asiatica]